MSLSRTILVLLGSIRLSYSDLEPLLHYRQHTNMNVWSVPRSVAAEFIKKATCQAVNGDGGEYLLNGNWKPLIPELKLPEGTSVRTSPNGSAEFSIGEEGTFLKLGPASHLVFEQMAVIPGQQLVSLIKLDLRKGTLTGSVKTRADASRFEVKTPEGVAGIRGGGEGATKFSLQANGMVRAKTGGFSTADTDHEHGQSKDTPLDEVDPFEDRK